MPHMATQPHVIWPLPISSTLSHTTLTPGSCLFLFIICIVLSPTSGPLYRLQGYRPHLHHSGFHLDSASSRKAFSDIPVSQVSPAWPSFLLIFVCGVMQLFCAPHSLFCEHHEGETTYGWFTKESPISNTGFTGNTYSMCVAERIHIFTLQKTYEVVGLSLLYRWGNRIRKEKWIKREAWKDQRIGTAWARSLNTHKQHSILSACLSPLMGVPWDMERLFPGYHCIPGTGAQSNSNNSDDKIVTHLFNPTSEISGAEIWEFNTLHVLVKLLGMYRIDRDLGQNIRYIEHWYIVERVKLPLFNHFITYKDKNFIRFIVEWIFTPWLQTILQSHSNQNSMVLAQKQAQMNRIDQSTQKWTHTLMVN